MQATHTMIRATINPGASLTTISKNASPHWTKRLQEPRSGPRNSHGTKGKKIPVRPVTQDGPHRIQCSKTNGPHNKRRARPMALKYERTEDGCDMAIKPYFKTTVERLGVLHAPTGL